MLRVPNPSSKPDFSPNLRYQICNPICSACLLTDAHHEVKALIGAIWIMNLHSPGLKNIILLVNTLLLPTLVDISILKPLLSSAQSSSESQSSLCYFSLLLYLRRTSAGSLRNKSFRPRSSRKLGRKHNKEWGGEKGNACSEKCMKQFPKMYKQLLIGAVLVVLIKE